MPDVPAIVSSLRFSIGDPKTEDIRIVREAITLATGGLPEFFYTKNMPIVSGQTINFRADRWLYALVSNETAAENLRAYVFDYDDGSYKIPTGAVAATSGDTVYGTYSYLADKEYEYQDSELYEYVREATNWIQSIRSLGLTGVGVGTGYTLSPDPNDLDAFLIEVASKYLVSKDKEELGLSDGILIKELDITIDTTKGSKNRFESTKELKVLFTEILYALNLGDTASAAGLLDTYSTWVASDVVGTEYESNESDGSKGLGESIE